MRAGDAKVGLLYRIDVQEHLGLLCRMLFVNGKGEAIFEMITGPGRGGRVMKQPDDEVASASPKLGAWVREKHRSTRSRPEGWAESAAAAVWYDPPSRGWHAQAFVAGASITFAHSREAGERLIDETLKRHDFELTPDPRNDP